MKYITALTGRALAVLSVICIPILAYYLAGEDAITDATISAVLSGNPLHLDTADSYYGSNEPRIAAATPVDADSWTVLPNINNPRFESSVVQYRDDLYVFNGFGPGINVEPAVEKFDAGMQKWSVIGNTSVALGNAVTHNGFLVIGDEVWMLGGLIGNHPGAMTSNVWKFNLITHD